MFGNKPTGFGTATTQSTGFGSGGLFGNNNKSTSSSLFGNTSSFGTANNSGTVQMVIPYTLLCCGTLLMLEHFSNLQVHCSVGIKRQDSATREDHCLETQVATLLEACLEMLTKLDLEIPLSETPLGLAIQPGLVSLLYSFAAAKFNF